MSAKHPLHILILEDNPIDADLLGDALAQADFEFQIFRAENEAEYTAQLSEPLDLILADYHLPQFNALQALQVLQSRGLDIPFIVVTGAVSEETAVECMKQGAADYLLKDRLARLGQAVAKALADKDLREEQRKTEEEVRRLKAFNENIVQTMTEGVVLLDAEGVITFVNPAAAAMVGDTPKQSVGLSLPDTKRLIPADQHAFFDAALEGRGRAKINRYELDVLSRDGTRRTLFISSSPRFEDGRFVGTLAVLTDISDRKRAEEEIRSLAKFPEEDPQPVFRFRHDGLALYANASGRRLLAESGGAADNYAPALWRDLITSAVENRSAERIDVEVHDKTWSLMCAPILEETYVNLYGTDITQRKRAEESLAQERNMLRTLIDSLPDRIYAKDSEGRFTLKNKADARQMGAASTDEVIGKTDLDYYPVELAEQYYADDQAVIQSGQLLINREEPVMAADGDLGWILTTKVPLRDNQGNVIGLVGIGRDITERKRAEADLQRQMQVVEEMRLFLQTTLDAFPANTVVLDTNGVIINANFSWIVFAEQNNALSPMYFVGTNYLTVCDTASGPWSEEATSAADGIRAVIHGSQDEFYLEYPCHSASERRWFAMRVTPFPEPAPRRVVIAHLNVTERKQTEAWLQDAHDVLEQRVVERTAQLEVAKERVEAILNNSPDGIVLMSSDLRVEHSNATFNRLFACEADDFLCKPLLALVQPEYTDRLTETIQAARAERPSAPLDLRAHRQDGTVFDAALSLRSIKGDGLVCTISDITQRKAAEKALAQALTVVNQRNHALQALHETASDISSELKMSALLRRVVERAVQLLEADRGGGVYLYAPEQNLLRLAAGSGINEHREGVTLELSEGVAGQVFRTRRPFIVNDYTSWDKHAAILVADPPSAVMGVPLLAQEAVVGALLLVADSTRRAFEERDIQLAEMFATYASVALQNARLYDQAQQEIDQRKQAENTLREQHEFLQQVINNVPGLIMVKDSAGRFQLVNQHLAEIHSTTPLDMLGKTDADFNPNQAEVAFFLQKDREALETGQPAFIPEETVLGRYYQTSKIPLKNHGGEYDRLLVVASDITERTKAELVLRNALETEKELVALKSRFISVASHEFRTPLATILVTTDTLLSYRNRLAEDRIEQKLTTIKEQVRHLTDIMDDVLLLARMEARRAEFSPVTFDLDALCHSVVEEFQSQPANHHHLVYTFDGSVREAMLDKKLIRQIISNLVSNAIKYSPPDKPVSIHLESTAEGVVLSVSDQGIGIPEGDQKHLFEPFHRAGNVGSISGTGLGLVITKESVEMHGGTITVESQVNVGTTFIIRIPATGSGRYQQ